MARFLQLHIPFHSIGLHLAYAITVPTTYGMDLAGEISMARILQGEEVCQGYLECWHDICRGIFLAGILHVI